MTIQHTASTRGRTVRFGREMSRRSFLRAAAAGVVGPSFLACTEQDPMRVIDIGDPRLLERYRMPTLPAPPTGANALGLGSGRDGIL